MTMAMTIPHLTYHQLVLAARQLPLPERVRFVRDILAEPLEDTRQAQNGEPLENIVQEGEPNNTKAQDSNNVSEPLENIVQEGEQQSKPRSILSILEDHHRFLDEHPEHRMFASAEEVDAYLQEERNSWDR